MKKRCASLLLVFITLFTLCAAALASETYVVYIPGKGNSGFTYVYDQPSDTRGKNIGRFDAGTYITVYRTSGSWLYVSGTSSAGRKVYGYIRSSDAVPEEEYRNRYPDDLYVINCFNSSCPGYCYVYDRTNSSSGRNLGRMDNGTEVTLLGTKGQWLQITGYNTRGKMITGYIHDYSAVSANEYYNNDDSDLYEEWVIDCTSRGKKVCYIYDEKSSSDGNNLGWVSNGDIVYVVEYDPAWLYVKATTARGKTVMGYIHTWCARPND